MTPTRYRQQRRIRGTQTEVARALSVSWRTIQRREAGDVPITREMWMAILALPVRGVTDRDLVDAANDLNRKAAVAWARKFGNAKK